jgi:hypothetical protein
MPSVDAYWNAKGEKTLLDAPPLDYMTWTKAEGDSVLDKPEKKLEKKALKGFNLFKKEVEVIEARFLPSPVNIVCVILDLFLAQH